MQNGIVNQKSKNYFSEAQETQLNLKNYLDTIAEPFISRAPLTPEQRSGYMVKAVGFCPVLVCEYVCVQMSIHVDQKEVNAVCFPPPFSTLILEEGSLTEPPRQWSSPRWAGQQAPGTLLPSPPQH